MIIEKKELDSKMKKIAVLGGTGMAGHVAVAYLKEHGYDVHYMSLSAPDTEKSKPIDATNTLAVHTWLESIKPDVVLNCIGALQKESDTKPDRAILLNAYLPRYLEQRFIDTSVKIIHLSTDCVFSGKQGGYIEADFTDGDTVYDRTKALGEIVNNKDLTFRMSIIGPDCSVNGTGLFNWFMAQRGIVKGFTKAMWNGVSTIELARAVCVAIEQDLNGLYHLVPEKPIDKYNLLLLFKDAFNRADVDIEPFDGFVVDKTLVNTRTDFDFEVRDYAQQVKDMRDWVDGHKDLYMHY